MLTDLESTGPNNLTQDEAEARAGLVGAVEYELAISLRAGSPDYEGDCIIRFEHADPSAGTFLDFTGKEILRFELNGAEVDAASWRSHRLQLEGGLLRAQNEVRIVYRDRDAVLAAKPNGIKTIGRIHVDTALRHERTGDANAGFFTQQPELFTCAFTNAAVARNNDRALGVFQHGEGLIDDFAIRH